MAPPRAGLTDAASVLGNPWLPWAALLLLVVDIAAYRLLKRRRSKGAAAAPPSDRAKKILALWRMSRPQNIPMSMLLVLAGAFGAGGSAWLSMPGVRAQVLLCIFITVLVTTSSCVVNDYYDFLSATDSEESQGSRPLVKGDISAPEVKRVLKWVYFIVLVCICFVETSALRIYVLLNAVLTYLYTKALKPRGFMWKNGCVSLIIAMAIGLGAVAVQSETAGSLARGLATVFPAMVATFFGIFAREVIMDVSDVEGDTAAGIRTLPVVAGPTAALRCARLLTLPVLAAQLVALSASGRELVAPGPVLLLLFGAGGLAFLAVRAAQGGPKGKQVRQAIELFPLPLAVVVGHTLAV